MKKAKPLNVAIVGAGRVGSTLGRVLVNHGVRITCVVSRSLVSARRAGKFLRCRQVSTTLSSLPPETNLIYITTPHGAVEKVARCLAHVEHLDFPHLSVCHASGMLTADALKPLEQRGATVFSFHPLQTFPRDFEPKDIVASTGGIFYGIDGSSKGLRVARQFARALGGRVIEIPPDMRPFYHAACVVASNHLTTMLSIVQQMFYILCRGRNDFYRVFKPIVMATLNNVEATSPTQALSGPIARGGVGTIREHLAQVRTRAPELLPYFACMTEETAKLARRKGSIGQDRLRAMLRLVKEYNP